MGIPCIGRGQKRFKFVDEGQQLAFRERETSTNSSIESNVADRSLMLGKPSYTLSNQLTKLIAAFSSNIEPFADIKVQLPWNFGDFLSYIPCRLGTNDALDAAAQALVTSYAHFIAGDVVATSDVLIDHSNALSTLRRCLDDPVVAYSSETLCSTLILLLVQTLPGINGDDVRKHSIGATHVLKGRGFTGPKDEFEAKLLLSLRGPVIIEGLISGEVSMTPQQWQDLVCSPIDIDTSDGQMMKCFAQLPDLMRRGRQALRSSTMSMFDHSSIAEEMHALRDSFTPILKDLRDRWQDADDNTMMQYMPCPAYIQSKALCGIIHAHYGRSYGIALTCGIILNCMLVAIEGDISGLDEESSQLSDEILYLAGAVTQYRPLGTLYMVICLVAAWAVAADPAKKAIAETWLVSYQSDTQGPSARLSPSWLEYFKRRCYLI